MKIGSAILIATLLLFLTSLFGAKYQLTSESLHQSITDQKHLQQIESAVAPMMNKEYSSVISFNKDFHSIINHINDENRAQQKWDQVIYTDYTFALTKNSNHGFVRDHNVMLLIILLSL